MGNVRKNIQLMSPLRRHLSLIILKWSLFKIKQKPLTKGFLRYKVV